MTVYTRVDVKFSANQTESDIFFKFIYLSIYFLSFKENKYNEQC